jgi:hypothetical protein
MLRVYRRDGRDTFYENLLSRISKVLKIDDEGLYTLTIEGAAKPTYRGRRMLSNPRGKATNGNPT